MTQKTKRIRDLRRIPKDYPIVRKWILEEGWIPLILCDTNGSYWDGMTSIDKNGRIQNAMSESQRRQMINMIHEGYFGAEILDALVDETNHSKMRDNLIAWPNTQLIAQTGLRTMQFQNNSRDCLPRQSE